MSFIRPEAAQTLSKWREALAGSAAAGFGAFWMVTEDGARLLIGIVLAMGGALLIFAGIQRARFRTGSGGPGLVQVDEGLLTYFGPLDGGSLHVEDLYRLDLDGSSAPSASWVLSHQAGDDLHIPVNAEGADALFDVFAALPGIQTEAMLGKLRSNPRIRLTIWEKPRPRLH